MKTAFAILTLPVWLPLLITAGAASLACGMALVVIGATFKERHEPDPWDLA